MTIKIISKFKHYMGHAMWGALATLVVGMFIRHPAILLTGFFIGLIQEGLQVFWSWPHPEKPHRAILDTFDFGFGSLFATSVILGFPWYMSLSCLALGIGFAVLISEWSVLK